MALIRKQMRLSWGSARERKWLAMTDELTDVMNDTARLRDPIDRALKIHPESELAVKTIALTLDTDTGDRLDDSPEQIKQNQIAFRKRGLANLRERA